MTTAINRSALRRNSATTLMNRIKESNESKGGGKTEDNRMWQPTVDTNGNGMAIVRFLPAQNEDSLPYVKQFNQGFKVGNKWFINNCPTSIGLPSPAVEHCNELWESGLEEDKKIARERKRKLRYFSNVLIIKDPKNPEAEGQVKIFTYGQKIFEKLMAVLNPPEEFGEDPRDPFSFFDGCVMKIKVRKKDGYRNYDETTVEPAADLYNGDEDKLTDLLGKLHDIDDLNAPDKFKSYDQLKTELMRVIGGNVGGSENSPVQQRHQERMRPDNSKEYGSEIEEKPKASRQPAAETDDDDDDLAMFQSLTADD